MSAAAVAARSSLGVLAAVPPTNVCSVPPTTVFGVGCGRSRPSETTPTAIVSMTNDARIAAGQIERPVRGAWSVPTLVLMAPSFRSCRSDASNVGRCPPEVGALEHLARGDLAHPRLGGLGCGHRRFRGRRSPTAGRDAADHGPVRRHRRVDRLGRTARARRGQGARRRVRHADEPCGRGLRRRDPGVHGRRDLRVLRRSRRPRGRSRTRGASRAADHRGRRRLRGRGRGRLGDRGLQRPGGPEQRAGRGRARGRRGRADRRARRHDQRRRAAAERRRARVRSRSARGPRRAWANGSCSSRSAR